MVMGFDRIADVHAAPPETQRDIYRAYIRHAARRYISDTGADAGTVARIVAADLDDITAAAWIAAAERSAGAPVTIGTAYNAAYRAVQNAYRAHKRAQTRTAAAEDADTQHTQYPGPEAAAIAIDAIQRAARDRIDKGLVSARAAGYNVTEAAEMAGISRQAAHKRIARMRAAIQEG